MATTNYGLPTITGNMSADIVRDHNALAEAVDTAIDTVDDKVTSHLEQMAQHNQFMDGTIKKQIVFGVNPALNCLTIDILNA